jgi:tripeptidyl-peptidase-1
VASSLAAVRHVREHPRDFEGFEKLSRADPRVVMPFSIALRQKNMDQLEAKILDAANPESPNYGQWLQRDEILDMIAPEPEVVESIEKWLLANGATQVDASGRDIIKAKASIRVIETLFKTQMYNFRHTTGKVQARHFGSITIPDEFARHVQLVAGITELWGPSVIKAQTRPASNKRNDVSAGYVIPEQIRALYGLPSTFWVNSKSSICVAEFQDDASYADSDNTYFNQQMLENVAVNQIVGPFDGSNPDAESTLDVQYAFSLALNATTWFWTVNGWMLDFATDLFNAKTSPLVVSMSWGWPEPLQCQIASCSDAQDYVNRTNAEFMKITGTGITLLAASGDQGSPGDSNPYCDNAQTPISTIFPGASPWILSIGASMLDPSATTGGTPNYQAPVCQTMQCATITKEIPCTYPGALITTGGGFSNYVKRASWQDAMVTKYLKSGVTLPPSSAFQSGNRGFPDVSALGHAYLIAIDGQLEQVDGTSCSSPLWAAIISLFNDLRLDNGKSPVGFVNPLIYTIAAKVPTAFNDLSVGDNKCTESCCATIGYVSGKGWDPVTGLGTPNFAPMISYIKSLP